MAKPNPLIVYHASPIGNLHVVGMDPNAKPHVTRTRSGWNYLGSSDYVFNQYLKYAPKGVYYVYKVDITDLDADDYKLAGDQQRYGSRISNRHISIVSVVNTKQTNMKGIKCVL